MQSLIILYTDFIFNLFSPYVDGVYFSVIFGGMFQMHVKDSAQEMPGGKWLNETHTALERVPIIWISLVDNN